MICQTSVSIQFQLPLIDGERMVRLMVRHGIGVSTRGTRKIKRIDEDYFDLEAL